MVGIMLEVPYLFGDICATKSGLAEMCSISRGVMECYVSVCT